MFVLEQKGERRDKTSLYNYFTVETFDSFEDAKKASILLKTLVENINEAQFIMCPLPEFRIVHYMK